MFKHIKAISAPVLAGVICSIAGVASAAEYNFSFTDASETGTGNFTVVGTTVVSGSATFDTAALGSFTATLSPGAGSDRSFIYDNQFSVDNSGLLFENASRGDEVNIFPNPNIFAGVGTTPNVNLYVSNPIASGTYGVADVGTLSITAVPEAATWCLMLMGIGAMGVTLRNSRRQQAFAV